MAERLVRVFLNRGPRLLRKSADDLRPLVETLAKARKSGDLDEEGDRITGRLEDALREMDQALADINA